MAEIFFSYNREDQFVARNITLDLKKEGFSVFFDINSPVGDVCDSIIEQELATAGAVLVLWSEKSQESPRVKRAARYALKKNLLCSAMIRRCAVPPELLGVQISNLIDRKPGDLAHEEWRSLVDTYVTRCVNGEQDEALHSPPESGAVKSEEQKPQPEPIHHSWMTLLANPNGVDEVSHEVKNQDDLGVIEDIIKSTANQQIIRNAMVVIRRLATKWYGRTLKRTPTSKVMQDLYIDAPSQVIRLEAAATLAALGSTSAKRFLLVELPKMTPDVFAATLAYWVDNIETWDNLETWSAQLKPALIVWISRSPDDCLFIDKDGREVDCRMNAFAILGQLQAEESAIVIERYLLNQIRPTAVIVQAAAAHWEITKQETFVHILQRAATTESSNEARRWLEEIRLSKLPRIDILERNNEPNDIEFVSGSFTRTTEFKFEVYFEKSPSVDTFKLTRISEMYSKHPVCTAGG